jgi:hypothetical protein
MSSELQQIVDQIELKLKEDKIDDKSIELLKTQFIKLSTLGIKPEESDRIGKKIADKLQSQIAPKVKPTEEIVLETPKQEPEKFEDFTQFETDNGSQYKPSKAPIILKSDIDNTVIDVDFLATLDTAQLKAEAAKLYPVGPETLEKDKQKMYQKRKQLKSKVKIFKQGGAEKTKVSKKEKKEDEFIEKLEQEDNKEMIKDIWEMQEKLGMDLYSPKIMDSKSRPELTQMMEKLSRQIVDQVYKQEDEAPQDTEAVLKLIARTHRGVETIGNSITRFMGKGELLKGATQNLFGNPESREELKRLLPSLIKKYPAIKKFANSEYTLIYIIIENMGTTIYQNSAKKVIEDTFGAKITVSNGGPVFQPTNDINGGISLNDVVKQDEKKS